jgi:hypothetical protein
MGFDTNGTGSAFSPLNVEKNIYVITEEEGQDAVVSRTSKKSIIGLGQALLTSYSLTAEVGGFIDGSATFEGLNAVSYTGYTGQALIKPNVDPQSGSLISGGYFNLPLFEEPLSSGINDNINDHYPFAAATASNIELQFLNSNVFANVLSATGSTINVRSFRADFTFPRQQMLKLGSVYPDNRPVTYPIEVNLSVDAYVNQFKEDQLNNLGCITTTGNNLLLRVNNICNEAENIPISIEFNGFQLQRQNESVAVGSMETISINWNGTISNPNNLSNNVIFRHLSCIDYITGLDGSNTFDLVTNYGDYFFMFKPCEYYLYGMDALSYSEYPLVSNSGDNLIGN